MDVGSSPYVLVIEDDPGVRSGMEAVIESEGFPVVSYSDAKQALDHLHRTTDLPRMIVLDFVMPVMDGWTFLAEIRKDARLRDIAVVGMSASQILIEQKDPPDQVDEFLSKPFKVEAMIQSIQRHWFPKNPIRLA